MIPPVFGLPARSPQPGPVREGVGGRLGREPACPLARATLWLVVCVLLLGAACDGPRLAPGPQGPSEVPGGPIRLSQGELHCERDYAEALQRAERQGKPLMVVFAHPESRNCYELAEEGFRHPKVVGLSKRFVCLVVDVREAGDLCQRHEVTHFPTVQFLSNTGRPLNRFVGKRPPHEVAGEMQQALQSLARRIELPGQPVLR